MLNILIIEDHPLIAEAYKNSLHLISSNNQKLKFKIDIASNCDSAIEKVNKPLKRNIFFLDIRLPASKNGKILSGEDLAPLIRKLHPNSKIIVSTMLNDNFLISNIIKRINPDAFLLKDELTLAVLTKAIQAIINGELFYSKTVLKILRNNTSNDFLLDYIDRKLLYELSIGTKVKDLPNIIPLSLAGIEKRKQRINKIFQMERSNNKELIQIAKQKGII